MKVMYELQSNLLSLYHMTAWWWWWTMRETKKRKKNLAISLNCYTIAPLRIFMCFLKRPKCAIINIVFTTSMNIFLIYKSFHTAEWIKITTTLTVIISKNLNSNDFQGAIYENSGDVNWHRKRMKKKMKNDDRNNYFRNYEPLRYSAGKKKKLYHVPPTALFV